MSKFVAPIIAISLMILTAADYAGAQDWRAFRTPDGLIDNSVYEILEDQHGMLWIGTSSGLSQFDGFFTTHLSGMRIGVLLESQDGTIWAAGTRDGLHSYDGSGWQEHLSGMEVYSLLESQDGTIWAAGTLDGLHSYDGASWQEHLRGMNIESLLESQDGTMWAGTLDGLHSYDGSRWQEHLRGMQVYSLLESQDGIIWAGTRDGLHSYDGSRWQEHLSGMNIVESLLESQDGTIWVGTRDGLHSYDGASWQEHLRGMNIESLLESQDGTIWAAGTWNGLHSYDGASWQEHLSRMKVESLLESQDGTIWAGTSDGLHSYDGTTYQEHLSGMNISSLLESQDGIIWAGALDGLHSYDGSRWQEHLSGMNIISLLESQDGTIWVGAEVNRMITLPLLGSQDGTTWVEAEVNHLHSYDGREWQEHLSGMITISLLESRGGTIWAGTYGDGLHSYDGRKWQEHLSGMNIESLLESQDGTIWVGTYGNGLHSYDGASWQEHLSGMKVESLLESQDGIIWAGTSDGLHSYDGTTYQEHLSGMNISSLLEFQDGIIWAGTWDGLHSYDGSRWQEHLSGMDISSLLESQDGIIWVGTYGGLHSYDGISWQEHLRGMIIISLLESQDGTIWVGTNSEGSIAFRLDRTPPVIEITEPQELEIRIGNSSLLVTWRAGDTRTETHLLTYQYRIDSGKWSEPISVNSMMTPIMEDGDHTLYVRAIDGFSNYSKPDTLTIIVDTIQPTSTINFPARGARVSSGGGDIKVVGTATDSDFSGYTVECQSHAAGDWTLIDHVSASDLPDPSGVRNDVLATWNVAELKPGVYTLRLTVRDILDHERSDTVTVEVVSAVKEIIALKGGHVGTEGLDLYIPPRALEGDEEITLTMLSRERLDGLALADVSLLPPDVFPTNIFLELKSEGPRTPILRKPATITIPYSEEDIIGVTDERRLSLFLWEEEAEEWQKIGGTVYTNKNTEKNAIKATITRLSVLAVVEDRRAFAGEPSISQIHCQPRVFSPNMDGDSPRVYSIRTHISFNVGQESTVTIKIHDMDGRLRRTLIKEEWVSQGIQVFLWDGRDDAQEVLPSGLYFVVVKAGDQTGTKTVVIQNR